MKLRFVSNRLIERGNTPLIWWEKIVANVRNFCKKQKEVPIKVRREKNFLTITFDLRYDFDEKVNKYLKKLKGGTNVKRY